MTIPRITSILAALAMLLSPASAQTAASKSTPAPAEKPKRERAPNATLETSDLAEFSKQPPAVQALISEALALTKRNLTYSFGSADPARGGMDCSGTIYYLLRNAGYKDVPRDSSGQYSWARKAGGFRAVVSKSADSFEFNELQPGDLLFWSGTYQTKREIPISHVMIYLGTEKRRKKRVMAGASDGRSYDGAQRWGVSVFDFVMPRVTSDPARAKVDFVGYARIPGLRTAAAPPIASVTPPSKPEPDPAVSPAPEPAADKEKKTAGTKTTSKSSTPKPDKTSTTAASKTAATEKSAKTESASGTKSGSTAAKTDKGGFKPKSTPAPSTAKSTKSAKSKTTASKPASKSKSSTKKKKEANPLTKVLDKIGL